MGDGRRFGARIAYSAEGEPLETAGGIAKALPLLREEGDCAFLCVAADIYTDFDYARLLPRLDALECGVEPGMHLVMTDNPAFHAGGDFALAADGLLRADGERKLTFSSIGLYDTRMFAAIQAGSFVPMRPFYDAAIAVGRASGEYFNGAWHNVGTPQQLQQLDAQLRAVPVEAMSAPSLPGARRILGIDPGGRITGFGVIDLLGQQRHYVASGCIRTPPGAPLSERIRVIVDGLFGVIDTYQPQAAAIEQVFVNVNPAATLMLGQARGACIAALVLRDLPVAEYTALQVKQSVAGHGKAAKEQVQHMVVRMLNLSGTPQADAADALAVALAHANLSAGALGQLAQSGENSRRPAGIAACLLSLEERTRT